MLTGCQSSTSDYLPCWGPHLVNISSSLACLSLCLTASRPLTISPTQDWKEKDCESKTSPSLPTQGAGIARGEGNCNWERGAGTSPQPSLPLGRREGTEQGLDRGGRPAPLHLRYLSCRAGPENKCTPQGPGPMCCHVLLPVWFQIVTNLPESQFFSSSKWGWLYLIQRIKISEII